MAPAESGPCATHVQNRHHHAAGYLPAYRSGPELRYSHSHRLAIPGEATAAVKAARRGCSQRPASGRTAMSVCVLAGYALSDAAADGRWEHRKRRGVCSRVSGRGVCEYVCVSACSEAKEQKQVRRISSSRERVRAKARESASTMRRQLSPCSLCLCLLRAASASCRIPHAPA